MIYENGVFHKFSLLLLFSLSLSLSIYICYGLTAIFDPMWYLDHIIEGATCVIYEKTFLKLTTDGVIFSFGRIAPSFGNGPRSSSNVYSVCKECCYVVLGFVSCV